MQPGYQMELLMHSIENECMLQQRKGYHSTGKDETTVKQTLADLVDKIIFTRITGRESYPPFPDCDIHLLMCLIMMICIHG